jgi:hypothetical protein
MLNSQLQTISPIQPEISYTTKGSELVVQQFWSKWNSKIQYQL